MYIIKILTHANIFEWPEDFNKICDFWEIHVFYRSAKTRCAWLSIAQQLGLRARAETIIEWTIKIIVVIVIVTAIVIVIAIVYLL